MDVFKWKRVWKNMANIVHDRKLNTRQEPHGISVAERNLKEPKTMPKVARSKVPNRAS